MKVLNLQCSQRHCFEGWFGSEEDFQSQLVRQLVECPMCNDSVIAKMPSAPRLNFGGHTAPALPATNSDSSSTAAASTPAAPASAGTAFAVADTDAASPGQQAVFLKALRHVLANTEDVGNRFADQARAMHYGDAEQRSIRGQTTPREAMDLMDEGIEVMPLPMPAAFKETLQ